jgi:predicted transcriptional regulator of viral defense system
VDVRLVRALRTYSPRQARLVARWQLRAFDVPDDAIEWACRAGHLETYRRGVLWLPGTQEHETQAILAACLAAGPQAVASPWAAGALHGLKGVAPGAIEISGPPPLRTRLRGVIVHRLAGPLLAPDRCQLQGVPATSVAKTLVDLAASGLIWLVERALDDGLSTDLQSAQR